MLNELKKEANRTLTENGAATLRSTGSDCLDLFATIGALRNAEGQEIIVRFARAYAEDRDLAMKMLFYSRDIRGGLGERRVFRTILKHLADVQPESVRKNLQLVSEYGRWDDLTVLLGTRCEKDAMALIREQLAKDLSALDAGENISLMAKWLPSVNTSNAAAVKDGKRIAKALGMTDAEYRRTLVRLRAKIRILENNLRQKDYTFAYSAQPSRAMLKYRKAFRRNDEERYTAFLEQVSRGEETVHTGTLYPYDIVEKALRFRGDETERKALDVTWNALEDYAPQGNALCVIDSSGSMYGGGTPIPATVAMSLGMYFAEHCRGEFHNHFITFSRNPQLVEIKGNDLVEKVRYCETFNEVANTSIQKVFELILSAAVKNKLPQEDLPETLYFISDMEFDWCTQDAGLTNFEYAKKLFEAHGYRLPKVVFWNVQSRNRQQPVSMNERGVILISGCTPRIFSMVAGGKFDPVLLMKEVLLSERYAPVCA
ncbi:MAG: DUF2828 family protein [Clostridia bacterium]|nr:DUF2828 family protein [Clostridia bacterium]